MGLQIFQILIKTVSEQDLPASSLSALHLHHSLTPGHLLLLSLETLSTLFHLFEFALVPRLLCFPFLPLTVGNVRHDFHVFFDLLVLLVFSLLVKIFDFFLVQFFLLFDEALLKPVFESSLAFFILVLFLKTLVLFFAQFLLPFEGLCDKFAFLPLVHTLGPLLVFLVENRLLLD